MTASGADSDAVRRSQVDSDRACARGEDFAARTGVFVREARPCTPSTKTTPVHTSGSRCAPSRRRLRACAMGRARNPLCYREKNHRASSASPYFREWLEVGLLDGRGGDGRPSTPGPETAPAAAPARWRDPRVTPDADASSTLVRVGTWATPPSRVARIARHSAPTARP